MAGLFGGSPSPPPRMEVIAPPALPEPKPAVVMPVADPMAQQNAEAKKRAAARARTTTRASTVLGDDEGLGG